MRRLSPSDDRVLKALLHAVYFVVGGNLCASLWSVVAVFHLGQWDPGVGHLESLIRRGIVSTLFSLLAGTSFTVGLVGMVMHPSRMFVSRFYLWSALSATIPVVLLLWGLPLMPPPYRDVPVILMIVLCLLLGYWVPRIPALPPSSRLSSSS